MTPPARKPEPPPRSRWAWPAVVGAALGLAGVSAFLLGRLPESSSASRAKAEAAAHAGDWPRALELWRSVNRAGAGDAHSYLAEARACLALGRAGQAERALTEASRHDPRNPEPWLIRQEIARAENRQFDAMNMSWQAFDNVAPASRPAVLRGLMLALLADAPDDLARDTLKRWIEADPEDLDARAALHRRMIENPRASDPPPAQRIQELDTLLANHPDHVALREALTLVLAEAGDPARGRAILDAWPEPRDVRYDRLEGRWALEYESQPARAVEALQRAVRQFPHDWKTRYRLARALQAAGRSAEARHEAGEVARLRELLEPVTLGQRLDAAFEQKDQAAMARQLADICDAAGLERLARAWREVASQPVDVSAEHHELDRPLLPPMRTVPTR